MYKITKRFIALWLSGVPFKIQACVEIHFNSYSEYSIFVNFHLVLVKLMCPALSVPRVFDWAVEVIWIWHLKNTASRSPIKHFFRYVGPADWADAHVGVHICLMSIFWLWYQIRWSHEVKRTRLFMSTAAFLCLVLILLHILSVMR